MLILSVANFPFRWGKHFDGMEFMTGEHYVGLPTVVIPIKDESRDTLWPKVKCVQREGVENNRR